MSNLYAVASNLVGFQSSALRVKVTRQEYGMVWCVTADLLDAGTPLVLNANQVEIEKAEEVTAHKNGLVCFA